VIGGLARGTLLWAGRSPRFRDRLSKQPVIAEAARRFVPGGGVADALGVTVDLQVLGIGTLYTWLREPVTDPAGAQAVVDHHLELLARIQDAEIAGEVSVGLAQLGLGIDEGVCLTHLRTIAGAAQAQGSFLWIDMEDGAPVDRTLDLYQRLRVTHTNTGICLGASLRRTARDVEKLLPLAPAVRLVKGARDGPRAAAFTSKKEIDANFLGLAVTLLRESRSRTGMRVALGTHDVTMVEQIAVHAAAAGIGKDAFEVHGLYGVRAKQQRWLVRSGYRVHTLIPYGDAWWDWYLRRVAERPANMLDILRQALPW
jgi:proline dehydrogenase